MTKKEELIIGILKEDLKGLRKVLKDQEKQIADIRKNGISKETHPAYHLEIHTGLSYTSGYCTGHIKCAESTIELLGMTSKEIEELLAENKRISAENDKYLKEIFKDIKGRTKKPTRKLKSHPMEDKKRIKKIENVIRNLNKKK